MERRAALRVPVRMFVTQYVMDQPFRTLVTSLSASGLYARRLILPIDRRSPIVTLDVELPGASESVVARGEIAYDVFDANFHETAIHFADMPRKHRRLVRDFCETRRLEGLRGFVSSLRRSVPAA